MKQEMQENSGSRLTAAALGVFDGVHLGHRRVLAQAVAKGYCHVVTFAAETMPEKQGHSLRYIYHDEQKRRLLLTCGADAVFALPFGEIRALDGETFCRQILRDFIGVDWVVCGEEYRFGRKAGWGAHDLVRFGQKLGFGVEVVKQVREEDGNLAVSSRSPRYSRKPHPCRS